jgi:hypothetical protein
VRTSFVGFSHQAVCAAPEHPFIVATHLFGMLFSLMASVYGVYGFGFMDYGLSVKIFHNLNNNIVYLTYKQ